MMVYSKSTFLSKQRWMSKYRKHINWGLPFLDVISTACSVLCPIACEKLQATRAGFKPATPAFQCRRLNHLTTQLVDVMRIRMGIAVGTAMHLEIENRLFMISSTRRTCYTNRSRAGNAQPTYSLCWHALCNPSWCIQILLKNEGFRMVKVKVES